MQMANQPPEMQGRYPLDAIAKFKHIIDEYFALPETHRRILDAIDARQKDIFKGDNTRTMKRVTFDLASIRDFNKQLFQFIVAAPLEAIPLFVDPIEDLLVTDVDMAKRLQKAEPDKKQAAKNRQFETKGRTNLEKPKIFINFSGYLGRNFVHPRGLRANLANQLVQVKGIVTRVSTVGQRILESAHYVENLDIGIVRQYEDKYDFKADLVAQSGFMGVPETDPQGNQMSLEYGFSEYKDIQTAVLQELPENSPIGALPRSVQVLLQNDLVDQCKPGDRIRVMGVYKPMATPATSKNGNFKMILLATGIVHEQEQSDVMPDSSEIRHIRNLSKNPEVYEILARSVAPSIQGLTDPKKAILLQLLGGEEKMLSTGTHVRGDINILLLGDPSTGKSQLMRNVLKIANRAIATTGRGATGVGLTAAVHINKETNQRVLEAGAMVLADRGVICIDEFDKMNDVDRVAIHEVMEQQTVTIAKAGIHASLNARCSVLAAANPSYGSYIRDMRPSDNINMPDSLLSRFDLLFITLDTPDKHQDYVIANRVIGNHSYRAPRGQRMDVFEKELEAREGYLQPQELYGDKRDTLKEQADKDGVYMKHDPKLHGHSRDHKIVTRSFLKKYLSYAKRTHPTLSAQAKEYITEQWNLLRRYYEKHDCNMPVTVRQLETLLRLSAARAKLRLVSEVSEEDAVEAFRLLWISVFNKNPSVETLHAGADGVAPEMQIVKKRGGGVKKANSQKENKSQNSQKGKKERKREVNKFLQEEGYGGAEEEEEEEDSRVNIKREESSNVKREKKDSQRKEQEDDPIAMEIEKSIHSLTISKASKNKEQINRERALFLAAYQYSNKNEIDEIDVEDFFSFLKEHFSDNKLVRDRYKVHKYANVEEMVGDLHELDHQGKILLQQGQNTFTII